jgi:hypothetical protein
MAGMQRAAFTRSSPIRQAGLVACVAFLLAACQQDRADLGLAVAQPVVAAPGIPVALISLDGGSDAVRGQMQQALQTEAGSRKIEVVAADKNPRFKLRGYLDAYATSDGKTALSYVWDIYDSQKQRAHRVEGALPSGTASGGEAWAGISQDALRQAAASSMNEIAGFLVAQSSAAPATQIAGSAQAGRKPLSYAPLD